MQQLMLSLANAQETYGNVLVGVLRYAVPVMVVILLCWCLKPLLTFHREPEIWAWLCLEDESRLPITHWENVIGRSKRSDIVIDVPTVSKSHGVLTRYDDGSWSISDVDSADGILVNGRKISVCALSAEDVITIGEINMRLQPVPPRGENRLSQLRTRASAPKNVRNLLLLTVLQMVICLSFLLNNDAAAGWSILLGFGGISVMQWLLLIFYAGIRRSAFEVETLAFLLCTMGMAAIATVVPGETVKQLIAIGLGLSTYLLVGWSLRDLERAKKIRYAAGVAGVGFLLITLLFGTEYYGAKNWLNIGPFSLQPSELSKVCFVFMGASTMDRLMRKRNLVLFIAYSAAICGCLALMNDFGTALVFFCAFLVIAYLRSGSIGTVALAVAALVFAGVVALKIAPHAVRRFAAWRHIWEDPLDTGYQQTRALMCMVSGGMFGLGPGRGWMKNLFAADSDMVFATVCEEWGLAVGVFLLLTVIGLAFFAIRSAIVGRSSFYTIGSCTAVSILLVQVILNVLGMVDILPLTGVTFPFLSNGGSSMICSWGLLAFIKAADTRQNASFAVRLRKAKEEPEEWEPEEQEAEMNE